VSYDPLLSVLGLAALASASTPTTFAPTSVRSGVAVQAAALPSNPITGDLAVDSGDGNTLKWYDGTTWQVAGGSSGAVTSVNSQTGDVVISLGDLTAPGVQNSMFYHDTGVIVAADRMLFSGDSNHGSITLDTSNDINGSSPTLTLSGFSSPSYDFAGRISFTNNGAPRWDIWPYNAENIGDEGYDFRLLASGSFGTEDVILIQRDPAGPVSGAISFLRPLVLHLAEPVNPTAGMIYVDNASDTLRWYDGSGWVNAGGGPPGGADTQIQYNDGGSFAGSALLIFETGVVTIGSNTTNSQVGLDLNTAAANNRAIRWRSAGVTRWQLFVNPDTESGSDEGAVILLSAFNDAGSPIDNPISIVRKAGGLITLSRTVFVNGDVELEATKAFYLGGADTDGSWRFTRSGDDLLAQRREAGVYVTKQTISA